MGRFPLVAESRGCFLVVVHGLCGAGGALAAATIFSNSVGCLFNFVYGFLCCAKAFKFN